MVDILNLALPYFGLIFIGFACGKTRGLPESGLAWMNFFLLYVSLPALLFRIMSETPFSELNNLPFLIATTLATVSAIASQSLRTATSIEHGQQAIESRLQALGRAHDLLLQARWSSASLAHVVQGATEPYDSQGEGKFSIQGPDLKIASGAVIALAMTLNELCTNTTKFGALSVPAGRIEIAWTTDDENQRLRLTWSENGGPPVAPPGPPVPARQNAAAMPRHPRSS